MEKNQVKEDAGLMGNIEMIDSLIIDCNENMRKLITGNYVAFGNGMANMVRKLGLLREGVIKDIQSRDKQIEELKEKRESGDTNAP